jgi:hypothetical protein
MGWGNASQEDREIDDDEDRYGYFVQGSESPK